MNVRKLRLICFLAFAISSVAAPAAGQSEKAKVLLITGGHGFEEKAFLKVFQPDVIPLLSTTYPKSGKPLAWTRNQGKSRIVYLQLGHDHSAYENPRYRELVARAIQYVRKE